MYFIIRILQIPYSFLIVKKLMNGFLTLVSLSGWKTDELCKHFLVSSHDHNHRKNLNMTNLSFDSLIASLPSKSKMFSCCTKEAPHLPRPKVPEVTSKANKKLKSKNIYQTLNIFIKHQRFGTNFVVKM